MARAVEAFASVGRFLSGMVESKLLGVALGNGLIDRLAAGPQLQARLAHTLGLAPRGLDLLLGGLLRNGVIAREGEMVSLTPAFRETLQWRDLLEAKLAFADIVLPDIADLTGALLGDGGEFMARSRTFELFRYDRAKRRTAENRAATERWVSLLGTLTRYEAPALVELLDLDGVRRMLDVGGNCGELARAFAEGPPGIEARVFDLPVVCDIGRDHLATVAPSVGFVEGDLRNDALPPGQDLIVFKSVLHDWPEEDTATFIAKATMALAPGGRIAIFERTPFDFDAQLPAYHDLPNLMFMHFLRRPEAYAPMLAAAGLEVVHTANVTLDMPFFLLVAARSAAGEG